MKQNLSSPDTIIWNVKYNGGSAMLKQYPDILKPSDLCDILGISRKNVYALLASGEIKSRKIGRKYFICKDTFIKYLQK